MSPSFRSGAQAIAPLAIAVAILGLVFGYQAARAGFSVLAAATMSATTFAGSAQFAAVAIVAAGGTVASALAAAVLLNSRYLLLGFTVAPAMRGPWWKRLAMAQLVVDETWGIAHSAEGRFDAERLLGAGAVLFVAHVGSTAIGAALSRGVTDPARFGLDAAFPALFVILIAPHLTSTAARGVAAAGATIALLLTPFAPAGVPILAAAAASLIGLRR